MEDALRPAKQFDDVCMSAAMTWLIRIAQAPVSLLNGLSLVYIGLSDGLVPL